MEICINDQWGTVCDDLWDSNDANVVCSQLGYPTPATAYGTAYFGAGTGPIFLDSVGCTGSESSLLACYSDPIASHDCSHSEDAGVHCEGQAMSDLLFLTSCCCNSGYLCGPVRLHVHAYKHDHACRLLVQV